MYNTLIVSDITDAITSFSRLGSFEKYNFVITGQAKTASELNQKSESGDISLFIVEEGFSGMSYQEINDVIRKSNPTAEVIAISVSDSPIREKRVISLGAFAYLRRPLASGSFDIILSGAENRLDRTQKTIIKADTTSPNSDKIKSIVLKGLITSPLFIQSNEQLINEVKLNLNKDRFVIFLIKNQNLDETVKLCNSYLSDKYCYECFSVEKLCVVILSESSDKIENEKKIIFEELSIILQKLQGAISCSYVFSDIFECSSAYAYALTNFDGAAESSALFSFNKEKVEDSVSELIKTVRSGDIDSLKEKVMQTISKSQLNAEEMTFVGIKVLENIFDLVDVNDKDANKSFAKMSAFVCNTAFRTELLNILSIASSNAKKEKISTSHNFANECFDYINIKYADSSLSVKTLSDKMNISQNYLSTLMKKYYGDTFVNILLKIRMEKAKELLLTTKKKVSAVCAEVGYSDSHYFSYSFKKYFGVTPIEMREKGESDET